MNLDPRKRFRESANGKTWSNAVASDWFQEGVTATLMTMALSTGLAPDSESADAVARRMEGARLFIQVMLTLTDTEPDPKQPAMPSNLKPTK